MTVKDKLEEFNNVHQDALEHINDTVNNDKEIGSLVEWILTTDQNPYSYLGDYANNTYTATGMSSLIHIMQHAAYDDGEMWFVKDKYGEPQISFEEEYENILDIEPREFPQVYMTYAKEQLKRNFTMDAGRGDKEAIEHYSKNSLWEECWLEECKDEIKKWEEFYNG